MAALKMIGRSVMANAQLKTATLRGLNRACEWEDIRSGDELALTRIARGERSGRWTAFRIVTVDRYYDPLA